MVLCKLRFPFFRVFRSLSSFLFIGTTVFAFIFGVRIVVIAFLKVFFLISVVSFHVHVWVSEGVRHRQDAVHCLGCVLYHALILLDLPGSFFFIFVLFILHTSVLKFLAFHNAGSVFMFTVSVNEKQRFLVFVNLRFFSFSLLRVKAFTTLY